MSSKPTGWGMGGSKSGMRWGKKDTAKLKKSMEAWCTEKGLGSDGMQRLISEHKHVHELRGAWLDIAKGVEGRTVYSCYRRAQQAFDPRAPKDRKSSLWTKESREQLRSLVKTHGKQWVLIGQKVGRLPTACRDRYREECKPKKARKASNPGKRRAWTGEEQYRLVAAVKKYAPGDARVAGTWEQVATEVETRGGDACKQKWRLHLHEQTVVSDPSSWWNAPRNLALIRAIVATGVEEEAEVGWSVLMARTFPRESSSVEAPNGRAAKLHFATLRMAVPSPARTGSFDALLSALEAQCAATSGTARALPAAAAVVASAPPAAARAAAKSGTKRKRSRAATIAASVR